MVISCLTLLLSLVYFFNTAYTKKVLVSKNALLQTNAQLFLTSTYELVSRVVDGDTIELDNGQKVRYIGINTPETVDPRRAVQCFGHEASEYNKQLVEGKQVRLVKDVSETDKYGRLLRYVYLNDGTFVNLNLVENGFARVDTYPPDVAHAKEFEAADKAARIAKIGLWEKCKYIIN